MAAERGDQLQPDVGGTSAAWKHLASQGQQPDRQHRRLARGWASSDLTGTNVTGALDAAAGPAGQLRRPDPDHGPAARQPGHRRGHQRRRRPHHRPARPRPRPAPSTSAPSRARASPSRLSPAAPRRPRTIGTAFANPLAVTVTANNPVEPVDGGVVSFVANPRPMAPRRSSRPPRPSSPAARPPSPPRPTTPSAVTPSSRPPRARPPSRSL